MHVRSKRFLTAALAAVFLVTGVATSVAATKLTSKQAMNKGAQWLKQRKPSQLDYGFKADVVNALTAARLAGGDVSKAADDKFVKAMADDAPGYVQTAGAAGKLAMMTVNAGIDPRCFRGTGSNKIDLVAAINEHYDPENGQFGRTSFDHALALLGLKAAASKIPGKAVTFAKNARGKRGWNFSMNSSEGDDVESTALMIEALRAAGVSRTYLKAPYRWLTYQQNSQGGFSPDQANEGGSHITNVNATAYAVRAASAMRYDAKKSRAALRALQKKDGSFMKSPSVAPESYTLATSDAVIALSGKHHPIKRRSSEGTSCL